MMTKFAQMQKLSVVIITYNEARNIGRCLDSIQTIADDIVVIDSFSTDETAEICRAHNVNLIQKEWLGYSATKNFANQHAKFDWIFSIDADEAISEELKQSILQVKTSIQVPTEYKINRLVNYCGKWIRHGGWYPDIKLRFFDRRKSKWQGTIHEKLLHTDYDKAPLLKGDCYHFTYYTLEEHRQQSHHFTDIAAQTLFTEGKIAGLQKRLLSPAAKFIGDYFLKLGFLDGYYGYKIAKISAHASYLKYAKLQKLYKP